MPIHRHSFNRIAFPLWASALSLSISAPAFAQEAAPSPDERSPYYIGASQTFTHDSNVYRSSTNEISETISITGF